ncbi:hypothetical protein [Ferrovibrio terrae]|uniref:hypothetical protein n=1 Tax=Ferrovibrio terrae TaxID=2594003 RepID=UPI003137BC65
MHNVMRLAIIAVAALTAACTNLTVPAEKLNEIKSLAVVPVLDDEFHLYFYGLTILDNQHETADVADWKLNEFLGQKARELLTPRYKVVPGGEIDRAAALAANRFTDDAASHGERAYAALKHKDPQVDAYLFLIREKDWDLEVNRNSGVQNVGLQRRSIAMRMPWAKYSQYNIYTVYRAYLVDGRSGKLIAQRPAWITPPDGSSGRATPLVQIPEGDSWPRTLPAIMQEHRSLLETKTKELLVSSLTFTLRGLGLLVE